MISDVEMQHEQDVLVGFGWAGLTQVLSGCLRVSGGLHLVPLTVASHTPQATEIIHSSEDIDQT